MSKYIVAGYATAMNEISRYLRVPVGFNGKLEQFEFPMDDQYLIRSNLSLIASSLTGEFVYLNRSGQSVEKGVRLNHKEGVFYSDIDTVAIPNKSVPSLVTGTTSGTTSGSAASSMLLDDSYMDALFGVVLAYQLMSGKVGNTRFLSYRSLIKIHHGRVSALDC